jgi:hypothetical protein
MNRREFIKGVLLAVAATHDFDVERMIWVPGEKTIFIPSPNHGITMSEIVAVEMERVLPKIREMFERNDTFYAELQNRKIIKTRSKPKSPITLTDME